MNDAFARLTGPIFQYAIDFQQGLHEGSHPELNEVKGELRVLFDEAERQAAVARDLSADFALAKHALVYWIDEVLINSSWNHAADWRDHILEWDFYHERLGGEKFYDKSEEAERLAGSDPLEVFYLCVALGFQGKYAFSRPELRRWSEATFARIAAGSSPPEKFLPDDPRDAERDALEPLPGTSILLSVSVLASASVLVTLACFLLAVTLAR